MSGKVFVVTGANKGIGYGIVRGLARQLRQSHIYLTARNPVLGENALAKLVAELGGAGKEAAKRLHFHQLDITDEASCKALAAHLKREHGGLDVLINNAGFAFKNNAKEPAGVQAEVTLEINYYGTKLISDTLIPMMREGGRLVNVCSQLGEMSRGSYKRELVDRFAQPDFTVDDIDAFVEEYKKLAHANKRRQGGFPENSYCVSKAAEIALSMMQARELKARDIIVNACCPGYCDTDLTSHMGFLTIDQGAETPIWLATAANVPSGQFVSQKKAKKWLH